MSSSFRSILQQVTQEKLEELKLQKNLMTSHFSPILTLQESGKGRLSLLYSAIKGSPVQESMDPVLIENLKYILSNSEEDPSISTQLISAWTTRVQGEIQFALRKCEYSYLYGSLLSEWLEVEEKRRRKGVQELDPDAVDTKQTSPTSAGGREKTLANLRSLLFSAPTEDAFNPGKFRDFLSQELFSFGDNVAGAEVLLQVKRETGDFFCPENYYISTHDVQCCIKGLNSEELLAPEKKAALKELADNPEALEEVASLLTSRLKNLDRWEWPSNIGQDVTEVRRGLAGQYQPFLNEDIITALFLQYVGVEWGAHFKRQFFAIYDSKGWSRQDARVDSVEGYRAQFYRSALLSSLPDSVASQENKNQDEYARVSVEDDEDDDEIESDDVMMDAMMPQMENFSRSMMAAPQAGMPGASFGGANMRKKRMVHPPPPPKPDIDFKQQFLHVLTTEIKLNSVLRPEQPLIVVQADLESFGPSIIHDAALIALEFLGVKKEWLNFFRKFLQPRIRFGEGDQAQTVLRGVPSAHALSKLFGETLLFLQDFLVNRKCHGLRLYRISDELWFWSPEPENAVRAWATLHTFGQMVGLKVNESRSGSTSVYSEAQFLQKFPGAAGATPGEVKIVPGPSPLPQKNIHWGYLQLTSSGIFSIDEKAVGKFLQEMKGLLDKSECVLEWINIFNKYFTFFIRNFGKSAVASGRQHLDQIVSALNQIYSGLLTPPTLPDPVSLLRSRFPGTLGSSDTVDDLVDAWVYWPLERGGLGLVNPFIAVMALRETFAESEKGSPLDLDFDKLPLQDRQTWEDLKKDWEKIYGPVGLEAPVSRGPQPVAPTYRQKLATWEEYVASRETELRHWYQRYLHLLERPGPKYPSLSDTYHSLEVIRGGGVDETERNYFMWLYSYYETQLRGHFGSVTFINAKLLPMSMIGNIQKAKVVHN